MRIGALQLVTFDDVAERAFLDRVAQHVLERYPQACAHLDGDALARRVRFAVARGRGHGLTWQSSLTGFVELMFAVGPDFDVYPAFAEALAEKEEDEDERIFTVYDTVTDEEWDAAQSASSGDDAWDTMMEGEAEP